MTKTLLLPLQAEDQAPTLRAPSGGTSVKAPTARK